MSQYDFGQNPPPFWQQFGFFFNYLRQEKLYYQITLLAAANILLLIPSLVLIILIKALLFLASYKMAFEVLHTVSSGQFIYQDAHSYEIDDKIGFKAISMAVVQLLIFIFVYRRDPVTGATLLILTLVVTPAFLMMLCKTQDLTSSYNPLSLGTVMTRIGFEYVVLLLFFLLCAAANWAFKYYTAGVLTGIIGQIISAWVLYFLLVFTFLVIGYVMYRHADDLGHDTVDVEVVEMKDKTEIDPIKTRVKALLASNEPREAIAIINEVKLEEQRTDLDPYLSQAQSMLTQLNRSRPADKLQKLVDDKQYRAALALFKEYLDDGHVIKPDDAATISRLIRYAFESNQFKMVLQLCRDFDKRYPLEYEQIIANYFMVAKIYYQNKKLPQAEKLLTSLIKKYQNKTDTKAISSYLRGIQKLNNT